MEEAMAQTTTDHDEIRQWSEAKGGKPAAVDRTHHAGDVGIVRIMFPESAQSEHEHLVEISWDEFFDEFEKNKLALVYDERSLFSKIIGRDTAERREEGEHGSRHHPVGSAGRHDAQGSARSPRNQDDDLASREYTDSEGNVHHHTRTYERDHKRG
jgi:hypothetical protein